MSFTHCLVPITRSICGSHVCRNCRDSVLPLFHAHYLFFFISAPCRREVTREFSAQAKQRLHSPETQPPPQHRHSTFPRQQPFDGPCPGEIYNLPLFSSSSQHTWEVESNQSPPQNGKQRQRQESPNILQKFCYTDRTLYVKSPNLIC